MAYPDFPDLSDDRFPDSGCDVIGIQRAYKDPAIATPFENGSVQTRPRFPRVLRTFVVPYRYVTPAKRVALDTFIRTTVMGGSAIFNWTDPETAEVIPVRFAPGKTPTITEAAYVANVLCHSFNVELEEV